MKKLLVALLSLGLIVAFSMSASAATVKFSGLYYVAGAYEDNRSLGDTGKSVSLADFWTRTRIKSDFNIAEGLTFTTQFDALEKRWGGTNWRGDYDDLSYSRPAAAKGTANAQENFEFEHAYVTFKTALGMFNVGYQAAGVWGTVFADTPYSYARIKYTVPVGPVTLLAVYEKTYETVSSTENSGKTDGDTDNYYLAGIGNFKGGNAGLLFKFVNARPVRAAAGYKAEAFGLVPYFKATFGPVYVEGEAVYLFGKTKKYDTAALGKDVDAAGWGGYVLAKMNFGPAFVGGQIGFSSGDDTTTMDKDESGPKSSTSWVPALIFTDANYKTWIGGSNPGGFDASAKQNLLLYNVFAGFNVTPKFVIETALTGMQADKTAAGVDKNYGYEWDVSATYKIYDNLSYMVGAGYLWTGDYFKGAKNATIGNDYAILNKLTLNF